MKPLKKKTNKIEKSLRSKRLEKVHSIANQYTDLQERIEYNENLHILPYTLKDLKLIGEYVLVALYKFTENTMLDGGLINPKYLEGTTDGGRPVASLDSFSHQARGIVVMMSDKAKEFCKDNNIPLQEGDTVWVSAGAVAPRNMFIHSRIHPVVDGKFLKLHPNQLDGIESSTPRRDITYQPNQDNQPN